MSGAIVLMYHRVSEVDADPWQLAVRPAHFAEQLEVMSRTMTVRPLTCLVSGWQRAFARRRTVAITFDDGYADNVRHARPLLEQHGFPATVFVVSGAMNERAGFWWDTLASALLSAGPLPPRLEITVSGAALAFELGDDDWSAADTARYRRWTMAEPAPTPRHHAFATVWRHLQTAGAREQQRAVETITGWAGRDGTTDGNARAMTPDEVAALAAGGLIEIGAHTVTHPVLGALPALHQREEIEGSRAALEAVVSRPVTAFSYPFGSHTPVTVDLVRRAGLSCACTTQPGRAGRQVSRFAIPRFHVPDIPGGEFERQLDRWLDDQG